MVVMVVVLMRFMDVVYFLSFLLSVLGIIPIYWLKYRLPKSINLNSITHSETCSCAAGDIFIFKQPPPVMILCNQT